VPAVPWWRDGSSRIGTTVGQSRPSRPQSPPPLLRSELPLWGPPFLLTIMRFLKPDPISPAGSAGPLYEAQRSGLGMGHSMGRAATGRRDHGHDGPHSRRHYPQARGYDAVGRGRDGTGARCQGVWGGWASIGGAGTCPVCLPQVLMLGRGQVPPPRPPLGMTPVIPVPPLKTLAPPTDPSGVGPFDPGSAP
jgi:hypothetical protein